MPMPDQITLPFRVKQIRAFDPADPTAPDAKYTFIYELARTNAPAGEDVQLVVTIKQATNNQYPVGQTMDIRFDQTP